MWEVLKREFMGGDEFSGQSWGPWSVVEKCANESNAIDRMISLATGVAVTTGVPHVEYTVYQP